MADKELRKMNRTELIEIIYALQQNERSLREENENLKRQMDDRIIRMERSGSIAEAALDLNHIFEDAQQAAQQYLESLRNADERASRILADAEKQAGEIMAAAEERVRKTEEECRVRKEETARDIQRQTDTFLRNVKRTLEKYPGLCTHMREDVE